MHSLLTQFLAVASNPWFLGLLILVTSNVGVYSGTPIPALEGVILAVALAKVPDVLASTTPTFQCAGTLFLMCWTASCVMMVGRFFCTSNFSIYWEAPSFGQLIWDFTAWLRKKEPYRGSRS